MRRSKFAAVAVVFAVGLSFWNLSRWNFAVHHTVATETVSKDLLASAVLDHHFDPVLRAGVAFMRSHYRITDRFAINDRCTPALVCLFVVDTRKPDPHIRAAVRNVLKLTDGNLITIQPNVILVDRQFLSLAMLDAYNASFALQLPLGESARDPKADYIAMRSAYDAHVLAKRFGNIQQFTMRTPFLPAVTDRMADGMTVVLLMKDLSQYPLIDFAGVTPLLLHELGHLKRGDGGAAFWNDMSNERAVLREEQGADLWAADHLEAFESDSTVPARDRVDSGWNIGSFSFLLRDIALDRLFDGFRSLSATEYRVGILYKPCTIASGVRRDFVDIDSINSGFVRLFPLVTHGEFDLLSKRAQAVAGKSHADIFFRSWAFEHLSYLTTPPISDYPLFADLSVHDARAFSADYRKYWSGRLNDWSVEGTRKPHTAITAGGWLKALSFRNAQPVVNCPTDECYEEPIPNTAGFVEAAFSHGYLVQARVVLRLLWPSSRASVKERLYKALYANGVAIATLRTFAASELGTDDDKRFESSLIPHYTSYIETLRGCGGATWEIRGQTSTLVMTTLNGSGWVSIDILPIRFGQHVREPIFLDYIR